MFYVLLVCMSKLDGKVEFYYLLLRNYIYRF